MKYPIVIKQSPLVLLRRIIEMEILVSIFLFLASFLTNYEQLYRTFTFGRVLRYDIFLFVGASLLQLLITVLVFFYWHSEEYRVKEKEVMYRRGFLMSKENSVLLKNVASVEYKRSPLEFLLGYGTIILKLNNGNETFAIRSVDQAEIYANIIKETLHLALDRPIESRKKLSVLDLILEGEHKRLEFKQTFRWDLKKKIINKDLEKASMKTIAAFLNTGGGNLLVGVADNGNIYGLDDDINTLVRKDTDGFENHFNQVFKATIGAEYREFVDLSFEKIEEKEVCLVEVRGAKKPAFLRANGDEEFFIRTGNTTTPLKVSEVNSYIESHWNQ